MMDIEVGQKWVTSSNNIVLIKCIDSTEGLTFPIYGEDINTGEGVSYLHTGRYYSTDSKSDWDLISLIEEKEELFKIGDVWLNGEGTEVTIVESNDTGLSGTEGGRNWHYHLDGRFITFGCANSYQHKRNLVSKKEEFKTQAEIWQYLLEGNVVHMKGCPQYYAMIEGSLHLVNKRGEVEAEFGQVMSFLSPENWEKVDPIWIPSKTTLCLVPHPSSSVGRVVVVTHYNHQKKKYVNEISGEEWDEVTPMTLSQAAELLN